MHELILDAEVAEHRKADSEVLPLILNRWSPRSYSGDPMSEEDLMACLEAARWAPSSYNEQPWRFLYAVSPEDRARFASCLVEFNQVWAGKAPVLLAVCAKRAFSHDGSENRNHAFDAGAAWVLFALEARRRGLYAHAMAGYDDEKARQVLRVPEGYEVLAFVALGRRGPKEALPEQMQKGEAPNGRKPVGEFAFDGAFPKD
jgi:nitroreductase